MSEASGSGRRAGAASRALAAACAVVLAGCASPSPAEPRQPTTAASYVDVSFRPTGIDAAVAGSPAREFVLAFLLAREGRCEPVWGSERALSDPALLADIAAVRAAGGSVTAASGGATGEYLENSCASPADLARAYTAALDATGADRLDVDVEAIVPTDLVADALARVQDDRGTAITLTLPVADAERGLESAYLPLVRALTARDVEITVNAMLMNFPVSGTWTDSLLAAADTVGEQLTAFGLSRDL